MSAGFDLLQDSLARQEEWGTDNFKGTFVNGEMAVSPDEAMNMSEEDYDQRLAESLAKGITRQGGNY